MISHKHNSIFIHIPKTAGTSISSCLRRGKFKKYGYTHRTHEQILKNGDKYAEYFKFSFIRNPFDKMVSEFKYFTNTQYKFPSDSVKKFYNNKSFSFFIRNFFTNKTGCRYHKMNFEQFLYPTEKIDFIGRFENLQEDFNIVCDKIGIPSKELSHINKTHHKHYTEYYDDETRQIVAEKYANDIEYFGYKFGE